MEQDPFKKQDDNVEQEQKSQDESNLRPIRTFKDDVSSLVKDQQLSTSKIMLAEQKRRQTQNINEQDIEEPSKIKGKVIKLFISVVLVVLGISAVIFVIRGDYSQQIMNIINLQNEKEDIIRKESETDINIGAKTNEELKREIARNIERLELENNEVREINISKTIYDEGNNQTEIPITSKEFLSIAETNISNKLERNLSDEFLFGLHRNQENIPFIILKTENPDLIFAEFFQWENRMYYDLLEVLDLKERPEEFIEQKVTTTTPATTTSESDVEDDSATTSTTTVTIQVPNPEPDFDPERFTDLLFLNRDIRAVEDEAGNIILMYSFVDDENILITKNRDTFREVIDRLSSQRLLR